MEVLRLNNILNLNRSNTSILTKFIERQSCLNDLEVINDCGSGLLPRNLKFPLKKLFLCHFYENQDEKMQVFDFLNNQKSTIEDFEIFGSFCIDSYRVILNEMPKLKVLQVSVNIKLPVGFSNLQSNHTVEDLMISGYNLQSSIFSYNMFPLLVKKFKNVRKLRLNVRTDRQLWQSILINMQNLETILNPCDPENFSNLVFPNVKKIAFDEHSNGFSALSEFRQIMKSFPNVQSLTIDVLRYPSDSFDPIFFEIEDYPDGLEYDILEIIADNWKNINFLSIGSRLKSNIKSLIRLLENCPNLQVIFIPFDEYEALKIKRSELHEQVKVLQAFEVKGTRIMNSKTGENLINNLLLKII